MKMEAEQTPPDSPKKLREPCGCSIEICPSTQPQPLGCRHTTLVIARKLFSSRAIRQGVRSLSTQRQHCVCVTCSPVTLIEIDLLYTQVLKNFNHGCPRAREDETEKQCAIKQGILKEHQRRKYHPRNHAPPLHLITAMADLQALADCTDDALLVSCHVSPFERLALTLHL